ncbi:probable ATP-dependent RNA helicase DDX28 isoform X2 [Prorops nasuta]|uniref:probable ATP-dependent RNA helicase DDX28 isoform X2 n=1 Tax=Prorops nasuta TaxID=863751 RepID=UPI0034CE0378
MFSCNNLCKNAIRNGFLNPKRFKKKLSTSLKKELPPLGHINIDKTENTIEELTPEPARVPIITFKHKKYNFYEGDSYPKGTPIPLRTRGWSHHKSKDYKVNLPDTFEHYDFCPGLPQILADFGWTQPTEIQDLAIPTVLMGINTMITAETGCGKTLAYLAPILSQVYRWKQHLEPQINSPLVVIVSPTRELSLQIGKIAKALGKRLDLKTKILIGGKAKKVMLNPTMEEVDILVASLGIVSKLTTTNIYKLHNVKHLVLDEADTLCHESYAEKLRIFVKRMNVKHFADLDHNGVPKTTQLTLVSATMTQSVVTVLGGIADMNAIETIKTKKFHNVLVLQKFMRLSGTQKAAELLKYVKSKVKQKEQVLIFSNTAETSDWISLFLNDSQISAVNLNSRMPLYLKRGKYVDFKQGNALVLSTTDGGSRGLDIPALKHILNYDFPLNTIDYLHRAGRTGRVRSPKDCRVTNFICRPLEIKLVQKIEWNIKKGRSFPIINLFSELNGESDELIEKDEEPMVYESEPADDYSEEDILQDEIHKIPY